MQQAEMAMKAATEAKENNWIRFLPILVYADSFYLSRQLPTKYPMVRWRVAQNVNLRSAFGVGYPPLRGAVDG
jgi:hypothetical protein